MGSVCTQHNTGRLAYRVGLARRDAGMLGLLMNTRGLVELVVLNAGLNSDPSAQAAAKGP